MSLAKDFIEDNYLAQMTEMSEKIDALERAVISLTAGLETDIIFQCEDTGAFYRPVVKTTDGIRPRLYLRPIATEDTATTFAFGGAG